MDSYTLLGAYINKNINLYVLGHRFPFVGKLKHIGEYTITLETIESDEQVFLTDKIVSFFETKENKKYIESK